MTDDKPSTIKTACALVTHARLDPHSHPRLVEAISAELRDRDDRLAAAEQSHATTRDNYERALDKIGELEAAVSEARTRHRIASECLMGSQAECERLRDGNEDQANRAVSTQVQLEDECEALRGGALSARDDDAPVGTSTTATVGETLMTKAPRRYDNETNEDLKPWQDLVVSAYHYHTEGHSSPPYGFTEVFAILALRKHRELMKEQGE